MKDYPKARGLFRAWLYAQRKRTDQIGEMARLAETTGAPVAGFRIGTWKEWAASVDLDSNIVEAAFTEYIRTPLTVKWAAYDLWRAR